MTNRRIAVCIMLIACKPLGLLVRAFRMVRFEQPRDVAPGAIMIRYDVYVHEIAYATAALALLCLLILLVPFRRREKWAWWAISIVAATYIIPEFVLPYLIPFRPYILWDWIYEAGLPRSAFLSLSLSLLTLLGLAASFSGFIARKNTITSNRVTK